MFTHMVPTDYYIMELIWGPFSNVEVFISNKLSYYENKRKIFIIRCIIFTDTFSSPVQTYVSVNNYSALRGLNIG